MFDRRTGPTGIVFIGPYIQGKPLKHSVSEGDPVELRIGENSIRITGISSIQGSKYKGKIHSFGPRPCLQLGDFKVGQEVEFSYDNIFSCG